MFDRFVRLAQARRLHAERRHDEALRKLRDPVVRDHRRAEELRSRVLDAILERAQRRKDAGVLDAALTDVRRVLTESPGHPVAEGLLQDLEVALADGTSRRDQGRELLAKGRDAALEGDLGAAEAMLATASRLSLGASDLLRLSSLISERRELAATRLGEARAALAAGDHEGAASKLADARGLDHRAAADIELPVQIAEQLGRKAAGMLDAGQTESGLEFVARLRRVVPEIDGVAALRKALARVRKDQSSRLRTLLEKGELEHALDLWRSLPERDPAATALAPLSEAFEELQRGLELERGGEFSEAAAHLERAARDLDVVALERRAAGLRSLVDDIDMGLQRARRLAAEEGRLVDARNQVLEILERHPGHLTARRELARLEQGVQDREARISEARALAREGALDEAIARVLSLAVPGAEGEEARVLLRDLQRRAEVTRQGVAQVLRSMHGRESASREGLAHCIRRLELLEREHRDHQELGDLLEAARVELQGVDLLDSARDALQGDRYDEFADRLGAVEGLAPRLLRTDRLEARTLDLLEIALDRAEAAMRSGRVARAERLLGACSALATGGSPLGGRRTALEAELAGRRGRSAAAAREGLAALADRDIERAEAALTEARESAADLTDVRRLERAVEDLRRREGTLEEIDEMVRSDDAAGAAARLAAMGPTSPMLRTRIFDLKRDLVRAQGIGDMFLLRVDEGGEFLVIRSESPTIGNLRDGSADLPMLASLAGIHARLRRTMSFHGGQTDRVVAERGVVRIRGREIAEAELSDGCRFHLGEHVELEYRLPSRRSLSAMLRIHGAFQIAGTQRILWMKDRGRDGRILIGPGKDVHVPVGSAEGEVELYADRDGRLRVRVPGEGRLDGVAFREEHPVQAGSVVQAAGLGFTLLGWSA